MASVLQCLVTCFRSCVDSIDSLSSLPPSTLSSLPPSALFSLPPSALSFLILLLCLLSCLSLCLAQVLRTLTYFNLLSEPSGQLVRQLSISLSDPSFQPCTVEIAVLNLPDAPVINLPDGSVGREMEGGRETMEEGDAHS